MCDGFEQSLRTVTKLRRSKSHPHHDEALGGHYRYRLSVVTEKPEDVIRQLVKLIRRRASWTNQPDLPSAIGAA